MDATDLTAHVKSLASAEGFAGVGIACLDALAPEEAFADWVRAGYAGQMDYLARYRGEFDRIRLAVNVDDVGYRKGRTSYSFYECSPHLEGRVEDALQPFGGLVRGPGPRSGDGDRQLGDGRTRDDRAARARLSAHGRDRSRDCSLVSPTVTARTVFP